LATGFQIVNHKDIFSGPWSYVEQTVGRANNMNLCFVRVLYGLVKWIHCVVYFRCLKRLIWRIQSLLNLDKTLQNHETFYVSMWVMDHQSLKFTGLATIFKLR